MRPNQDTRARRFCSVLRWRAACLLEQTERAVKGCRPDSCRATQPCRGCWLTVRAGRPARLAGCPAGKYWADPYTLFWVEAILMNFAELKRWQARAHRARAVPPSRAARRSGRPLRPRREPARWAQPAAAF